jgi:hypothetical protein
MWVTRVGRRPPNRCRNEACSGHLNLAQSAGDRQNNFEAREAAMHAIVAWMRFPGPNYYEVLRWLHEELKPASYLEIGVFQGRSLSLAMPPTIALGIDPRPRVDHHWQTQTQVLPMTSSEFFSRHSLAEFFRAQCFSLALIDGLHQFEQVIDDIFNLEVYSQPDSVIAVHDTIPLDEKTAARTRRTGFHTGDVWKVVPFLKQFRPDLETVTVRTGPSGLTLIRSLTPPRKKSQADTKALSRFRGLPWGYYIRHRNEFLETIPNEREAVAGWLSGRGCQPI